MMQFIQSHVPLSYPDAMRQMQEYVDCLKKNEQQSVGYIWFLEHEAVYTAGTSAVESDLLTASHGVPVYKTGRGGKYTFHGPGQLICYCVLDLIKLELDIKSYVKLLEKWIIDMLAYYKIHAFTRDGRVGVWVDVPNKGESKIAALGIRVSKGVSMHGFSINISVDLKKFVDIVPCGITNFGVTSLNELGVEATFQEVMCVLKDTIPRQFLKKHLL